MYNKMIKEILNCDDLIAEEVQEIMRNDIFHSTLDWQTKKEFEKGAKEAFELYQVQQKLNLLSNEMFKKPFYFLAPEEINVLYEKIGM